MLKRSDSPSPTISSALIDLLWTCLTNMFTNLTQSVDVLLNGVIFNFGNFSVFVPVSFSNSSFLCVASNSVSNFSYHIRRPCSSCRKRSSLRRCSSSRCCSRLASNRFHSISSSISSCLLFKNFVSLSLSAVNVEYLALTSFSHCLTDRADIP